MKLTLCAPCLFGLEGPLGNELRHMDMENVAPENGRVYFTGDESAVARANIRSRFAERVLIVLGRFPARTFDELFEGVRALPWEAFIPADGAFPVKGWALESALHSVPDCQKIVKKAVVERLKSVYGLSWFSEEGESFPIQFAIMKDEAALYIDTSGTGLHKRGYRPAQVAAPLRETLAGDYHLFASDIAPRAVALARENARRAGVEKYIDFSVADARDFSRKTENGTLSNNPPYGERLLEKEAAVELMRAFGKTMRETENWKTYVISSLENFENVYGKRADKRRRLYNGMIPCQLYMYL